MSEFENDFSPIWGPVLDGVFLDSDPVFGSPLNKMQQGEYLNYEVNILEISFICQVTGRGSILQKNRRYWALSALWAHKQIFRSRMKKRVGVRNDVIV
jgi:hypothetical protein